MPVKAVGGNDPPLIYAKPPYGRHGRPFHLINLDTANPVYYDDSPGVSSLSNIIYPLGRAGADGNSDIYASTLVPGLSVQVMLLPGHTAWDPGPVQTAAAITKSGIPPKVPGLTSVVIEAQNAETPTTWFTFPAASTIWGAGLSFSVASNNSFTAATAQFYAKIFTGSGLALTRRVELSLGGPNHEIAGGADLPIGGIPVAAQETLKIDVNNGVPVPSGGGVMHASAVVFYSTP